MTGNPVTVAVIGSFRQHYETAVLPAIRVFRSQGLSVTSPLAHKIEVPGIEFVRFASDRDDHTDAEVQTLALHRILRADFTYVVAPGGYVGRTTCYEIGRVVQARRPVVFSERPQDLPILVPESHIGSPGVAAQLAVAGKLKELHHDAPAGISEWEHKLLVGDYLRF